MRTCMWPRLALGLTLVGAPGASATDYWDASVIKDNSAIETYNEMYHGVSQQHDLEANAGPEADEDWSFVLANEFSSYEAIIDSTSADIDTSFAFTFERFAADGTSLQQLSEAANVGAPVTTNRALRWRSGDPFMLNFLRVRSGGCTTTCSAAAQYRIRFYETTITVPRFNNLAERPGRVLAARDQVRLPGGAVPELDEHRLQRNVRGADDELRLVEGLLVESHSGLPGNGGKGQGAGEATGEGEKRARPAPEGSVGLCHATPRRG